MIRRFFKRILTPPLVFVAACLMFFEEWVWDKLAALMASIGRLPIIRGLEARLAALPPYGAMAVFLLPGILLLPVKLAALYFMTKGHAVAGLSVIIAAKILGTALVARMFTVCKPKLLTINWFARLTAWVSRIKSALYSRIKQMAAWKAAVRAKDRVKAFLRKTRGGLGRRWRAIGRRLRWGRKKNHPVTAPSPPLPESPTAENSPHCE